MGEYPQFGLPAILVPYPYAWRYQKVNADYLANHGAAVVLEDARLKDDLLPLGEIFAGVTRKNWRICENPHCRYPDRMPHKKSPRSHPIIKKERRQECEMVSLTFMFWLFVLLFAIIGATRGWAKEILVTFAVILASS